MKRTESNSTFNSNQYTPAPYLDDMLQNSQSSRSSAMQVIGLGASIGSAFGPIGTAVGGFLGGLVCMIVCKHGNYYFVLSKKSIKMK